MKKEIIIKEALLDLRGRLNHITAYIITIGAGTVSRAVSGSMDSVTALGFVSLFGLAVGYGYTLHEIKKHKKKLEKELKDGWSVNIYHNDNDS